MILLFTSALVVAGLALAGAIALSAALKWLLLDWHYGGIVATAVPSGLGIWLILTMLFYLERTRKKN